MSEHFSDELKSPSKTEVKPRAKLSSRPLGATLGMEVEGLDLSHRLSGSNLDLMQKYLSEYRVLCFSAQEISQKELLDFGRCFGASQVNPIFEGTTEFPDVIRIEKKQGDRDIFSGRARLLGSYLDNPPKLALLYNPPSSASFDMIFASLTRAWLELSEQMQEILIGLTVTRCPASEFGPEAVEPRRFTGQAASPLIYSDALFQSVQHPMVQILPESGEKSLYVDEAFSYKIEGLHHEEGKAILGFLARHCMKPQNGCRITVRPGTLLMWDARTVSFIAPPVRTRDTRLCYMVALRSEERLRGATDPIEDQEFTS